MKKEEEAKTSIEDFVVNIEMTVRDLNVLLNSINMPSQTSATMAMYFINMLQNQAGPQVEKAAKSLKAVEEANEAKGSVK